MPKVAIKQDPENEVAIEILGQAIVDVAEGAKKLLSSRLTERAVVTLIQDYLGADARGNKVARRDIERVLAAAADLKFFLKKA
jgi:molybdenum-dependent DNA-binding transcriptional regulator ModE